MTYYTGLARVARKTGYPVVEVAGWKTRGNGQMGTIKTVVCHHTASNRNGGNANALKTVTHGRPGLSGPLSHFVLGRDGTIYVVAAGLSWHAGATQTPSQGNSSAIGIEAENDGIGEPWGNAQMDSYRKLCKALIDEFGLPVSAVQGHKEICKPRGRKIDPTFDMNKFRASLSGATGKPSVAVKPVGEVKPKPTVTKPPKKPVASRYTIARGKQIQSTLKSLGLYKGLIDGKIGSMSIASIKKYQSNQEYFPKLRVDGIWGDATESHYQWVKKELQPMLNRWAASKRVATLLTDGDYGKLVRKCVLNVQKSNSVAYKRVGGSLMDGLAGPVTCKLLGIKKHPFA